MFDIPCVIFAGGKSSRMGKDKSLLPFGEYSTLCEYQYRRLEKIFKKVYVVTKEPSKFPFKANFLEESYSVFAPTTGFVTLFEQLQDEAFFVLSVDTPFVDFAIIEQLFLEYKKTNQTTLTKLHNKLEPLCGIYTRSLEKEFVKMLQNNEHKLSKMLQKQHISFVTFKEEKKFFNLNYQDDYIKAQEFIKNML